jgi:HlyD family secretion protein
LFRCANGWCVYRVEHRRAQLRQVEIGRRNQEHAAVRHGLVEGERVIRYPGDRVTNGVRVKEK